MSLQSFAGVLGPFRFSFDADMGWDWGNLPIGLQKAIEFHTESALNLVDEYVPDEVATRADVVQKILKSTKVLRTEVVQKGGRLERPYRVVE